MKRRAIRKRKRRPLIEIPVGGSVEVERAFRPGVKRDETRAAKSSVSGFIVRGPRK